MVERLEPRVRSVVDSLLANLSGLLVAGHDTTVNQLGNSFVTLFRHPDQLQLPRPDPSLTASAVKELLRYTRLLATAERSPDLRLAVAPTS